MGRPNESTTAALGVVAVVVAIVAVAATQLSPFQPLASAPTDDLPVVADEAGPAAPEAEVGSEIGFRPGPPRAQASGPDGGGDQLAGPTFASEADLRLPEGQPTDTGPTVLRLVYFVESDSEADPAAVDAIQRQAEALQAFWYDQFGGTFRLPADGVEVVYGTEPARWYDETPNGGVERWNRLLNIRDELRTSTDLFDGTGRSRALVFPAARIDGRVGAKYYEGAWMDGDDVTCIDGIVETTPYTLDFPAHCLATLAHELGHVYGLDHQGADTDCMQLGFYRYVNGDEMCDFAADIRELVRADPRNAAWLDAVPGDRG